MSKYLRMIGVIELLLFVVALIYTVVDFVTTGFTGTSSPWEIVEFVFLIIALVIFGPALGVLFICVANLIDENSSRNLKIIKGPLYPKLRAESREHKLAESEKPIDLVSVTVPFGGWICSACGSINEPSTNICHKCRSVHK